MVLILFTLVFIVLRVLPGDPVAALEGRNIPEALLAARRHELGLDKPLYVQYVDYLSNLFRGDFGRSLVGSALIADQLILKLPATLELAIASMVVAVLVGIIMGATAAYRRNSLIDHGFKLYGMVIFSIPVFFLGLLFQLFFGLVLGLFPIGLRQSPLVEVQSVTGFIIIDSIITGNSAAAVDALHHLLLPSLTLGLYLSGIFVRISRVHMIETLRQDYVVAARARGLTERIVLYRYGLRNALIPVITLIGLQFAALLAGAVLTETTFSWPGIGSFLFQGILSRDYNAIQGAIVIYAGLVAVTSLAVDVVYAVVDPRIRY